MGITSTAEFLDLLRSKHNGSIADAFEELDEDCSGVVSIVELRNVVEKLLDLPPGTHVALPCVRVLFRELDSGRDGGVGLEDLEDAAINAAGRPRRRSSCGGSRKSSKEGGTRANSSTRKT